MSRWPENLAALEWLSHDCYHLLDLKVMIRCTSNSLNDQIQRLLRSFSMTRGCPQNPDLILSFVGSLPTQNSDCGPTYVYRNDEQVGTAEETWQLFRLLEWQLDIFLADKVQNYFLLHAGAVAKDGTGLILPGLTGNGKSSLTMALLLQGCRYLSDELAVIDPVTAELWAFPKPFSLKEPSLFPDLVGRPDLWLGPESAALNLRQQIDRNDRPVWYIHPEDVRPQAIAFGPTPLRYIFFPQYEPETTPQLRPLTPNEAMRKLLENSVNFSSFGQGGLHLLARLAREAQCFAVIVNGPELTAQLIKQTL